MSDDYEVFQKLDWLLCDCGELRLAKLIVPESGLYEWNCPECGLIRDIDA